MSTETLSNIGVAAPLDGLLLIFADVPDILLPLEPRLDPKTIIVKNKH